MIDFDDLESHREDLARKVAFVDRDGVPRGGCSCCDCLQWLDFRRDRGLWYGGALRAQAYRHKGVVNLDGDVPMELLGRPRIGADCGRCGCSAGSHEDLSDVVDHLFGTGALAEAGQNWTDIERWLFCQTRGLFRPGAPPDARRGGEEEVFVSVICPTSADRHRFHTNLYRCFCDQNYACKELVVVDTGCGPKPSTLFDKFCRTDTRVVYRYFDLPADAAPWSIGLKRNVACYFASGSVIVHFDDDDLYAPDYITRMLCALQVGKQSHSEDLPVRVVDEPAPKPPSSPDGGGEQRPRAMGSTIDAARWTGGSPSQQLSSPPLRCLSFAAEAATLSRWWTFDVLQGRFAVCDVDLDHDARRCWTLGYGFSFVYLREVWQQYWFRDMNLCEDSDFLEALLARGARVALVRDQVGFCAHTRHRGNFSPWEEVRSVPLESVSYELRASGLGLSMTLPEVNRSAKQALVHHVRDGAGWRRISLSSARSIVAQLAEALSDKEFQRRLLASWEKHKRDPAKQAQKRRDLCLEVQAPIISRFGFEPNHSGVAQCTASISRSGLMADEEILFNSWRIEYFCRPEQQELYADYQSTGSKWREDWSWSADTCQDGPCPAAAGGAVEAAEVEPPCPTQAIVRLRGRVI